MHEHRLGTVHYLCNRDSVSQARSLRDYTVSYTSQPPMMTHPVLAYPTTTTTPTTDNNCIDAPPPTISDTIISSPTLAMITGTNITRPTPATSVATSDYLPPATSNTPATRSTSDGESVLTCPHCDRTFTSGIGLVDHLRIHRTETGELVPVAPNTP
ncbi:unnamed protein product [Schistocephalus solidus]|uniref:C2H2-type domain-containing protein n=1 Tax=Schistocephalus solidus TaxID=70667 RepID=A0A183SKD0_SCHSO|nr:unnamed protein product [Schistocephalus solidus]